MNPVFIFLVILAAVVVWFLLAGVYSFVGKIVMRMINKSQKAMNDEPLYDIEKEKTD